MASSCASTFTTPPLIVTVPAESVSSSSGSALIPSSPAVTFTTPPSITTALSLAMPWLAAFAFTVTAPVTVILDSAAPLTAFLQAEPSAFRMPFPVIVSDAPDFTFIAAPSNASATVSSVESSSAGFSLSVRVTVPSAYTVAEASLLTERGAPYAEVRDRSFKIRVTPVTPFLTLIVPCVQEPVIS